MLGNEKGSSKTDMVVKLILVFFISLLSFSVGTFVGKQVSDRGHKKTADFDEHSGHQHDIEREAASIDAMESEEIEPAHALSDEEIESLTEEFVKAEQAQQAEVEKQVAKTDTAKTQRETASVKPAATTNTWSQEKTKEMMKEEIKKEEPSLAAQRVAANQPPSTNPIKKKGLSKVLPHVATSSVGKYTVQVASYGEESEAQKYAENLKSKGFSAFYVPAKIKGKTWYRVSVGLFSTHTSAANFRKELMKQANISSAIVQKIVR